MNPTLRNTIKNIKKTGKSISGSKILKELENQNFNLKGFTAKSYPLLNKDGILRNACTIATSRNSFLLCSIKADKGSELELQIYEQNRKPFAVFECKRVGVEEGISKGPQTIEKAKQGAYVARTASSLQKIRTESGEMHGIIYKSDNTFYLKPYKQFEPIREAFISSYSKNKKKNQFTKVQMNIEADRILLDYFSNNLTAVEN